MEKLSNLPLFAGMEEAGCQHMLECFHTGPRSFRAGETAYTYGGSSGRMLGILQSGCAALVKIDADGGRTVLERLGPGGVFGELIAFASLPCDSVTVVCEADCVIVFPAPSAACLLWKVLCLPQAAAGKPALPDFAKGLCPERAGGGALLPEHPGEAAVLLPHTALGRKKACPFPCPLL